MERADDTSSAVRKANAEVDVAVLILFFNRPDMLYQVFEQVRKAKPSRLLLYQDGPRNEQDMENIRACREIVANIDWQCEVHRNFLSKNQGCDPSGFRAQKWAFSKADKVIILEDDVVPSVSFFRFCKEMLDRYEHDERVMMVSGFNVDEVSEDVSGDYFFTSTFSIWGWATWKRVADKWDEHYSFMRDEYAMRQMKALIRDRRYRPDMLKMFKDHSESGKEYFETIAWAAMLLNSGLAIIPSVNMISNIGITDGGTHYTANLKTMPTKLRRLFMMNRKEITFPLRHQTFVTENYDYKERLYRVMAWGHPWIKIRYSIEELILNLRYGKFSNITKAVVKRLQKWTGTYKYR